MFRIKEIMQEKGITNVELARRMGMTSVSISYIVTGKTEPNITKLGEIANALGVEMWELFASREDILDSASSPSMVCPHCGKELTIEIK